MQLTAPFKAVQSCLMFRIERLKFNLAFYFQRVGVGFFLWFFIFELRFLISIFNPFN